MKVLVTGAGGFTGRALVLKLLDQGEEVVALVRNPDVCKDLEEKGARLLAGDIKSEESVREAVKGAEAVYHIAALFRRAGFPDSEYREVNIEGTRHLLDASVREGVKAFVHCSTIGVCGDIDNPPADENTPYNPGDIQAEARAFRQFADTFHLPVSQVHGFFPVTFHGKPEYIPPPPGRISKIRRKDKVNEFYSVARNQVFAVVTEERAGAYSSNPDIS
jgi:nucleoside-diphosphate-sugar epimerase